MYGFWLAGGALLCFGLLLLLLGRQERCLPTALLTCVLAATSGIVLAKTVYVLCFVNVTLAYDGILSFFEMKAGSFSVFGGMTGAMLGALLSAKLLKMPAADLTDRFVPALAVFLAALRAGEVHLGTIGVGSFVEAESPLARFPFAVQNTYGEHLYAIFLLEALFALLLALYLLLFARKWPVSIPTELGLFFLALPQILCESLRLRCMRWGFVRIEQLLCGLLVLALIWYACKQWKGGRIRWLPVVLCITGLAGVALLEYALDKTDIPVSACYTLMTLDLIVLGTMEGLLVKKRNR